MNKRGRFGPMSERVAQGQTSPMPTAPPALKHCWVTDRNGRLPGLLLEWDRTPTGFRGRVLHPVLDDDGWAVIEEWLPAEILERA